MFKKFAITFACIIAVYAVFPPVAIGVLGNFAIGWVAYDIVNNLTKEA